MLTWVYAKTLTFDVRVDSCAGAFARVDVQSCRVQTNGQSPPALLCNDQHVAPCPNEGILWPEVAMSTIDRQQALAEWRAKRDATRQAGSKPLEQVVNGSRLGPPATRAPGLKTGRSRSPAGCENEPAAVQAPATATATATATAAPAPEGQPRYLTATKSSQHRGTSAPAPVAARPDGSAAQPAQVRRSGLVLMAMQTT
jgi:hypothetical protein